MNIDCTHYIYVPNLFMPLWNEIYIQINNLFKYHNKISRNIILSNNNTNNQKIQPRFIQDYFNNLLNINKSTFIILKGSNELKSLYIIENQMKRQYFGSWKQFLILGYRNIDIEIIDDDILKLISNGNPIRVKTSNFSKIYL